jgi:hypothetical protein
MLGLTQAHSVSAFLVGASAFMFLMVFVVPYFTGIMATLDAGGTMASLSMGKQFCGFAFGPLLAVPLLRHGYWLSLCVSALLCLPAVVLMLFAEQTAQSRAQAVTPGCIR